MKNFLSKSKEDQKVFLIKVIMVLIIFLAGSVLTIYFTIEMPRKRTEHQLEDSGYFTQYPAGVKTNVIRMMVTNGISFSKISFLPPAEIEKSKHRELGLFSIKGGNAYYSKIPVQYMADWKERDWVFVPHFGVPFENKKYPNSVMLTAFANGITKDRCLDINKRSDIEGIPRLMRDQSDLYMQQKETKYSIPPKINYIESPQLINKAKGCFQSYDGKTYTYYYSMFLGD